MKGDNEMKLNTSKTFTLVLAAFLVLLSFESIQASSAALDSRTQNLAVQALSQKLQNDLANNSINVKLENAQRYNVSKSQIGIKGSGFCLLNADGEQLPINFDVKINTAKFVVSNVVYDFVEPKMNPLGASGAEDMLTKELLNKLSRDFKTTNIVISLDEVSGQDNLTPQNSISGAGEVRIGDFVWKKLEFNVSLEKGSISKINYKLED
jgi:hypothetical protein